MRQYIFVLFFLAFSLFLFSCGKSNKETSSLKQNGNQTAGNEKVETVEFKCDGMTCTGCEQTITDKVKKLDGIKEVIADYKAKNVKVIYAGNLTNKGEIQRAINDAGYDTEDSKSENPHESDKDKMKEQNK